MTMPRGNLPLVQRIGLGLFSMFLLVSGVFWANGAVAIIRDRNVASVLWVGVALLSLLGGLMLLIRVLRH